MRHPDPNFGYPSQSFVDQKRIVARMTQRFPKRPPRQGAGVMGSFIDATTWDEALQRIITWGAQHQSRYVTLCNVHSVVTASQDPAFAKVIAKADMALPDGAPIAWALRRQGHTSQERINGPDLMWRYLKLAEAKGQKVYFYGSAQNTLDHLRERLTKAFPALRVVGMVSPPYRQLTEAEDQAAVDHINQSGAHVVFVGLGCPKQEAWMQDHKGRVQAVMLGVGAAFDYHAGTIQRAPVWMQKAGLEWLHRLASEPRRLASRYLVTNTLFVAHMLRQMVDGESPSKPEHLR